MKTVPSDEAVEAARRAREEIVRSIDWASDGTDWPDPMRAALEAAYQVDGVRVPATPRYVEDELDGYAWPSGLSPENTNLTPVPAGDGGLREALERLAEKWATLDTPGLAAPSHQEWAQGVDQGYSNAAAEMLGAISDHPAAPAVPLPVDREAPRERIADAVQVAVFGTIDQAMYGEREHCDKITAAVLAVLAGEQEQVEP